MKLILLGPPGSGKGTVSEKLEKEFHLKHVSAGELLREEVRKSTTIGKDIQKIMEKGELVPDELITEIIKLEVKDKTNYILDGFPRTLGQAKAVEKLGVEKIIYLDVPEKVVIERFAGRRLCEKGVHGYHVKYLPPKKAGICDLDGSKLIQRPDDQPKIIKERFRVFHEKSQAVVDYYRKKRKLLVVDASQAPEEVYREVKRIIGK